MIEREKLSERHGEAGSFDEVARACQGPQARLLPNRIRRAHLGMAARQRLGGGGGGGGGGGLLLGSGIGRGFVDFPMSICWLPAGRFDGGLVRVRMS